MRKSNPSSNHPLGLNLRTLWINYGQPKSLKKIKGKLRNLKDASKAAKDSSKQTGATGAPFFSLYFLHINKRQEPFTVTQFF